MTDGEEGFAQLLEWGGQNLSEAEISAFNAALDNPDVGQAKLAIAGVKARMDASQPAPEPKFVQPTNTNNAPSKAPGFSNQREMMDAINKRDDRNRQIYGSDPVYTKEVEDKIKRSTFL